jgi:Holliday junction resolvase
MAVNSRQKGKRGELAACELLRRHGFMARRGQQNAGGVDSPDIIHNIPGWHIEVKWVQALNVRQAMAQAERDAGGVNKPCVLHKRNGEPWLVTIKAEDFLALLGGMDFSDL